MFYTYSGSLVSTFTESERVLIRSLRVLRRSIMCLGSPSASAIEALALIRMYKSVYSFSCDFLTKKKPIYFGTVSRTFLTTIV